MSSVSSITSIATTIPSNDVNEHFMNLAINQANISLPIQTGYCVGALLIEYKSNYNTENDYNGYRILSTGYSRELHGNTHAEECCLIKYNNLRSLDNTLNPINHDFLIYTTMEPCSLRLSCTELINDTNISTIIIGALEPKVFVDD